MTQTEHKLGHIVFHTFRLTLENNYLRSRTRRTQCKPCQVSRGSARLFALSSSRNAFVFFEKPNSVDILLTTIALKLTPAISRETSSQQNLL